MKQKNMKKFNKIDTLSKLVKEGFNIETLLKFDNNQLQALRKRVLNEAETEIVTTFSADEVRNEVNVEDFTGSIESKQDGTLELRKQQNEGETIEVEVTEEEIDPRYPEPKTYRDSEGQEKKILEKELPEEIMDMGAGDFDDTSFYNPYAGGFDDSQGPMDSYYSTDNKGRFVRSGMKGDAGRYSRNADYLDTPSFNNPDARGFDSYGPTDSYGGNGWDEGGFAGEMNEYGAREVDPKPAYHFKSGGPRGHSSGLHEDSEEDSSNSLEKMSGYDPYVGNTVGNEDGPSRNMKAPDGMGMFERYVTKKDLMEVAKSKSQYNFHKLVLACKKSKYKDCGDGRNDDAILRAATGMTIGEITDYTNTPNPENLPEKVKEQKITEQWLLSLVEKYERPSMTKGQFLQTLNEIAVKTKDVEMVDNDVEVIDNDVEDAKYELPSWLDFDSLFVNTTTKPAPTKTPTPTKKPGRKSPYKPKHRPKPKARK